VRRGASWCWRPAGSRVRPTAPCWHLWRHHVLAAVVFEKQPKPGLDFFPLTVNYQEKTRRGKIPGGFFKREGGRARMEVLTSRLIDRPIRPLFHESYRNETLVVVNRARRTTLRTIPTWSR